MEHFIAVIPSTEYQSDLQKTIQQLRELHGSGDDEAWQLARRGIENLHSIVFSHQEAE
jgi:hypothetical protein